MNNIAASEIALSRSPAKIVFGLLLIGAALGLLFWNEQGAVHRYEVYQDGPGQTISLTAPTLSPANEGKLVYIQGQISVDGDMRDRQLGVKGNYIKLRRKVTMYQWLERVTDSKAENTEEGQPKTNYTYYKGWSDKLNETMAFKKPIDPATNTYRINPSRMLFESMEIPSSEVKLGDFSIAAALVGSLGKYEKISVPEELLEKFPDIWKPRVKIINGDYYIGLGSPEEPKIGDLQITYEAIMPGFVATVLGKQVGSTINSFQSKFNGNIQEAKEGSVPLEAMFRNLPQSDIIIDFGIRVAAVLLAVIGSWALFSGLLFPASAIGFAVVVTAGLAGFMWSVNEMASYVCYGVAGLFGLLFLKSLKSAASKMPKISIARKRKQKEEVSVGYIQADTPAVSAPEEEKPKKKLFGGLRGRKKDAGPVMPPEYETNVITPGVQKSSVTQLPAYDEQIIALDPEPVNITEQDTQASIAESNAEQDHSQVESVEPMDDLQVMEEVPAQQFETEEVIAVEEPQTESLKLQEVPLEEPHYEQVETVPLQQEPVWEEVQIETNPEPKINTIPTPSVQQNVAEWEEDGGNDAAASDDTTTSTQSNNTQNDEKMIEGIGIQFASGMEDEKK